MSASDEGRNGGMQGKLMQKLVLGGATIAPVNSSFAPSHSSRVWLMRGALRD